MSTVTRARTVRHRLALAARRHTRTVAFAAVVGPGVLAGLSDDDPAGITTYSILGADFGFRLLWVLLLSTLALVVFHELGARMGCVTGRGLAGLIRDRCGHRAAVSAAAVLLVREKIPLMGDTRSARWALTQHELLREQNRLLEDQNRLLAGLPPLPREEVPSIIEGTPSGGKRANEPRPRGNA